MQGTPPARNRRGARQPRLIGTPDYSGPAGAKALQSAASAAPTFTS
jgi:hypothetical protein